MSTVETLTEDERRYLNMPGSQTWPDITRKALRIIDRMARRLDQVDEGRRAYAARAEAAERRLREAGTSVHDTRTFPALSAEATRQYNRAEAAEREVARLTTQLQELEARADLLECVQDCAEVWLDECVPLGNAETALAAAIREAAR